MAEAVGADFEFIDARMRWQDRERSRPYTMASWLVGAALLARRRAYDIFLVDNLHIPPVLMKRLFRRREQRIVAHLGSHTLYFLQSHYFTRLVERLHLWTLRNYDALLCEGHMSAVIARDLLGRAETHVYETFIGVSSERARLLSEVEPALESRKILFVGNGLDGFRLHYKGLDLMLDAVGIAATRDPAIVFEIVGAWSPETIADLMKTVTPAMQGRIVFRGVVSDIGSALSGAALYLHCSRGDAFPISTIEAMTAGVVPIVSEWTGTRELASDVSPDLVVRLEAAAIADRINWYFDLEPEERRRLSDASRRAAARYTEPAAVEHYRATFAAMCDDLGVQPGKLTVSAARESPIAPNKLATGLWFLKRPATYGHLGAMLRRTALGSERVRGHGSREALAWGEPLARSPQAVLTALFGEGAYPSPRDTYPDVFAQADFTVEQSGSALGGAANLQLLYHLTHGLQARRVVETGVAYGWSSLAILLAQQAVGAGELVSTDMPYPRMGRDDLVGCVVPERMRASWTLLRQPDRPGLTRAIRRLGVIDLAHYDSDKTYDGQSWAFPHLWKALRAGGALVVDDIDQQTAFRDFAVTLGVRPFVVDGQGKLIGVLVKADGPL